MNKRIQSGLVTVSFIMSVMITGCEQALPLPNVDEIKKPPVEKQENSSKPISAAALKTLNDFPEVMKTSYYQRYLENDPLLPLRCPFISNPDYEKIADRLGGFEKPYQIPIEKDAIEPVVLTGFEPLRPIFLPASSESSLTIQRPDLVGRQGNTAFYLSHDMGLYVVHIDEKNPDDTTISCALSLPGRPRNFFVKNNQLIILLESRDQHHGAIFQFEITGHQLNFIDAVLLENRLIRDARLFNDTLAVYSMVDQSDLANIGKNDYSLIFFDTSKTLVRLAENTFPIEQQKGNDLQTGWERHFYNDFLSASGSYLVVSSTHEKEVFDHNETSQHQDCVDSQEVSRQVCHIKWKRVPNPDYVDRPTRSVSCGTGLLECLRNVGPTLSRYIYVADGEECYDQKYFICRRYESREETHPVYKNVVSTKFVVFRFQDAHFVRLEDSLFQLNGDNLEASDQPLQIKGQIQKHDHLRFDDQFLYVLTTEKELTTFTIEGNVLIRTHTLPNLWEQTERLLSAKMTAEKIYIDVGRYAFDSDFTRIKVIDRGDPFRPNLSGEIRLPAGINQFLATNDEVLGMGSTTIRNASSHTYKSYGTITTFSKDGHELDSILLGTDFDGYSSHLNYDDQAVHFDDQRSRLLIPYTSSGFQPSVGWDQKNRLSLVEIRGNHLSTTATFDFPQSIQRSLSMNDHLALAFSNSTVYLLRNDSDPKWSKTVLLDATLPRSLYEIDSKHWALARYRDGFYDLTVVPASDIFTKNPVSKVEVPMADSHVCIPETLYFFDRGFLLVSEKPERNFTWEDCGRNSEENLQFQGWHVNDSGKWEVTDIETLQQAYKTISEHQRCIIDPDNFEGRPLLPTESIPDDLTCYTEKEYHSIRNDHYSF